MHRSYVSKAWIDEFLSDNKLLLPKDVEARFFSILRVKSQELVAVFDGCGRQITGFVQKGDEGAFFVNGNLIQQPKPVPEIIVVQAAIDEGKLEQTIQRGSELGVDRFVVFPSIRSDTFCFSKLLKRKDRLERIAEDAARQSGRYFVPIIEFVPQLRDVIDTRNGKGLGLFGDVAGTLLLSQQLVLQKNMSDAPCYIVVGPEGGIAPEEEALLTHHGFVGVQWAPYVLRAETASFAAVAIINAHLGRA